MTDAGREAALRLVAWARIWSPVASKELRIDAWKALRLPASFEEVEHEYWPTFHVGSPTPRVPLLFHAALGLEGGHAREEWVRVFQFLELQWQDAALPPDHLAAGCEALATAINRGDDVMAAELCSRYLLPWCEQALGRLEAESVSMAGLVRCFSDDLRASRSSTDRA